MNFNMFTAQKVIHCIKNQTTKPPKSVQPGGFRWVFDSPKSPLPTKVKPA